MQEELKERPAYEGRPIGLPRVRVIALYGLAVWLIFIAFVSYFLGGINPDIGYFEKRAISDMQKAGMSPSPSDCLHMLASVGVRVHTVAVWLQGLCLIATGFFLAVAPIRLWVRMTAALIIAFTIFALEMFAPLH